MRKTAANVFIEVHDEVRRAQARFSPMQSPHEGWAVIREEVDELWEDVRGGRGTSDYARTEAIQIAAVAIRYVLDLTGNETHADQG